MMTNGKIGSKCAERSVFGKSIVLASALSIVLMTAGCAVWYLGAGAAVGAAVGVGATAYVKGKLQTRMKADPRAIAKATEKSFEAMKIRKISSTNSATEAEVNGRTTEDTSIAVTAQADGTTGESSVYIRVGTFGDQAMSLKIYDEINKHLPDAKSELEKELKDKKP